MLLKKNFESPLDSTEIKPVNPKGNQPWIFIGSTGAEAEAPVIWPPNVKSRLIGKNPDAGEDWGYKEKISAALSLFSFKPLSLRSSSLSLEVFHSGPHPSPPWLPPPAPMDHRQRFMWGPEEAVGSQLYKASSTPALAKRTKPSRTPFHVPLAPKPLLRLFAAPQINCPSGFLDGKESAWQYRRHKRHRFDPWVRKIPWRRKWHPIPVLFPGKFHGQKSL